MAQKKEYDYEGTYGGYSNNGLNAYVSPYAADIANVTQKITNIPAVELPEYQSEYKPRIDALNNLVQEYNKNGFSYDYNADPMYQQYQNQYQRGGQRAMQDTMGQLAARTGGLASSYAAQAAQGSYNNYMAGLADKIPELRNTAYQMWVDKGNRMNDNLNTLRALENDNYSKYRDQVADALANREMTMSEYQKQLANLQDLDKANYARWQDEQDQYNNYLAMMAEMMAGNGGVSSDGYSGGGGSSSGGGNGGNNDADDIPDSGTSNTGNGYTLPLDQQRYLAEQMSSEWATGDRTNDLDTGHMPARQATSALIEQNVQNMAANKREGYINTLVDHGALSPDEALSLFNKYASDIPRTADGSKNLSNKTVKNRTASWNTYTKN